MFADGDQFKIQLTIGAKTVTRTVTFRPEDFSNIAQVSADELAGKLERLEVGESLYSDVAYVPWVLRARDMLGLELPAHLVDWLGELEQRPSIAAETGVVHSL